MPHRKRLSRSRLIEITSDRDRAVEKLVLLPNVQKQLLEAILIPEIRDVSPENVSVRAPQTCTTVS